MSFAMMLPEFAKLLNLFISLKCLWMLMRRLAGLSSIMVPILGMPS
jgi:hypothetical protein